MKVSSAVLPLTIGTLKEAVDDLPEPVLLLDPQLRLMHLNDAAEPLFAATQRWASTWRDPKAPDDQVSCLAPALLGRSCSGHGACEGCLLHDTLGHSLSRGESVAPMTIERTVLRGGRILTQVYEMTARAVPADGVTGFIVTLRAVERSRGDDGLGWTSFGRGDALHRPA